MIDSFVGLHSHSVKGLRYELFLTPVNIPIICLCLGVLMLAKSLHNAVSEKCFEFNLRSMIALSITEGWGTVIFSIIFESTKTFYIIYMKLSICRAVSIF